MVTAGQIIREESMGSGPTYPTFQELPFSLRCRFGLLKHWTSVHCYVWRKFFFPFNINVGGRLFLSFKFWPHWNELIMSSSSATSKGCVPFGKQKANSKLGFASGSSLGRYATTFWRGRNAATTLAPTPTAKRRRSCGRTWRTQTVSSAADVAGWLIWRLNVSLTLIQMPKWKERKKKEKKMPKWLYSVTLMVWEACWVRIWTFEHCYQNILVEHPSSFCESRVSWRWVSVERGLQICYGYFRRVCDAV